MNNDLNKELKKYFKEIKKKLNCKSYLKQGFIAQFKENLNEYIESHNEEDLTMEIIYKRFGTPDVIAKSFDDIEDLSKIREKSKRIIRSQMIAIMILITVIVILLVVAYMIYADSQVYINVSKNY